MRPTTVPPLITPELFIAHDATPASVRRQVYADNHQEINDNPVLLARLDKCRPVIVATADTASTHGALLLTATLALAEGDEVIAESLYPQSTRLRRRRRGLSLEQSAKWFAGVKFGNTVETIVRVFA